MEPEGGQAEWQGVGNPGQAVVVEVEVGQFGQAAQVGNLPAEAVVVEMELDQVGQAAEVGNLPAELVVVEGEGGQAGGQGGNRPR